MALALFASNLIHSQTIYYTTHAGTWSDSTAWSTIGIDSASCACSPGCNPLVGIVYIGNSITSFNCLNGIGPNSAITVNAGDTLSILISAVVGGKLPVISSTINILSGGVMIINGELDITAGDTINNSGILTVDGNVTDTNSGAYLAGGGVFISTGTVNGTAIFVNPQLWQPMPDTNNNDSGTNIVYNGGNVGIGTNNPSQPLEVNGNVVIDDTLSVPYILTSRIRSLPGDSGVHIGDSSVFENNTTNNLDGTYGGIALGVNPKPVSAGIAIGHGNTVSQALAIAVGLDNVMNKPYSITIGDNITNNIEGAILLGGYKSSGHTPAVSIIPDPVNGTAGFVGIGTMMPNSQLSIGVFSSSSVNAFSITNQSSGRNVFQIDPVGNTYAAGTFNLGNNVFSIDQNGNTFVNGNILTNGSVGIATTSLTYPLNVGGTIWSQEIRVCISGCDFVFDNKYKLMPIKELEQYLELNHHLPGIQSAKEMETTDGVELGKMNSKLLQKVEELTLYLIQQQKEIDELKEKLSKLADKSK